MMKRILILSFLMVLSCSEVIAQTTMTEVFKAMPDSIIPYLSKNGRLDLIDFKESGMTSRVNNELGNKTTLDTLTADYLCLSLSPASKFEMKFYPASVILPDSSNSVIKTTLTLGELYKVRVEKTYTNKWLRLK